MIVAAKLEMPDFEQALEMKVLDWEIFQAASEGLEYGRPKLRDVRFTFFDSKLMPYFFEWAKSSSSKRSGKIHYISSDMGKVECSFSFEDAVCSACHLHFNKNEELSLFCEVSLSVSLQKQDLVKGKGEKAKQVAAAPIEGEPKVLSCIFESEDGKTLSCPKKNQSIYLVVKTKDMIGKTINVDLSDDKIDYEYQGKYLENDLLENVKVTAENMRFQLKTLKQR